MRHIELTNRKLLQIEISVKIHNSPCILIKNGINIDEGPILYGTQKYLLPSKVDEKLE